MPGNRLVPLYIEVWDGVSLHRLEESLTFILHITDASLKDTLIFVYIVLV